MAQALPTFGALDFESFRVDSDTFVVLASAIDALASHEPLRIFKFRSNSTRDWLEPHQVRLLLERSCTRCVYYWKGGA